MFRSVYVWLFLLIAGVIGGAFLFLQYGGSTAPTDTNAGLLKTVNAAMNTGDPKAPVKMVEYADFLCPYCAKFAHETMPAIHSNYITTGKLQLEFRPVAVIAPDSARAAEGAYCAAEQDKFWDYYDAAYKISWDNYYSQGVKPEEVPLFKGNTIRTVAQSAGLDVANFMSCVDSGKYTSTVQEATTQFNKLTFNGTPTFLINKIRYQGFAPFDVVKPIIESYLK